jgi:hypothetical protein
MAKQKVVDLSPDYSHYRQTEPIRTAVVQMGVGEAHEVPVYKETVFGLLVDIKGLVRHVPLDWEVKA